MSAEDFIFRVEHLQQHNGMPWLELIRDFNRLLAYNASEWYWFLIRTKQPKHWPELRNALERRFCDNRSRTEAKIRKVTR